MNEQVLTPADRQILDEQLPWYVNGTLNRAERAWVDARLTESPEAVRMLAREQSLMGAVHDMQPVVADDAGLDAAIALIRAGKPSARERRAPWRGAWAAAMQWLAQPRLAGAMAMALVAQATVIGVLVAEPQEGSRSTAVTEVRTLRVTFLQSVTEAQIRAALPKVGARIVGGPNQLGEYWLASDVMSLDEMRASLMSLKLLDTAVVDKVGPRGH